MVVKQIVNFLDKTLPNAKYSDGKEVKCIFYRVCNIFDICDD